MAISTCTEYRQELVDQDAAAKAERALIGQQLQDCFDSLDQLFDGKSRFHASEIAHIVEPDNGFTKAEKSLLVKAKLCADEARAKTSAIDAKYSTLRVALQKEAFDKKVNVGLMAIYSPDQTSAAEAWMSAHGPGLLVGIEVHDVEELRAEIETDRCVGALALFASFDNGAIAVQVDQADVADLVASVQQTVQMKVSDYLYVDGPLQGDPPAALEDLKELLGAGVLDLGWTSVDSGPNVCELLTSDDQFTSDDLHGAEERTVEVKSLILYDDFDRRGFAYCERSLRRLSDDPCVSHPVHLHKDFDFKYVTGMETQTANTTSRLTQVQLKESAKLVVSANFGAPALASMGTQVEQAVERTEAHQKLSEVRLTVTYKEAYEESATLPLPDHTPQGYRIDVPCGFRTLIIVDGEITVRQKWHYDPVGRVCELDNEYEVLHASLDADISVDLQHGSDQVTSKQVPGSLPCP
ncbi:hypothetical protein [Cellulomonas humilata]|uniref:Uncharacterized protein n=1 Tax=Cellulomonas humilata TaxID=144055 RepID=A0ABU0EFP3_9CELL|nr:hypothetical protein [Cellulomonas humilata]MDQ0373913.1 hypothetical protein [Cellulomonas humilata]